MKDANEKYHDRVAARYDDVYGRDAYWEYYLEAGRRRIKKHLPRDLAHPVLDAGCGTGLYGLWLLKSGFKVVFADLSQKMLDRAEEKASAMPQRKNATFVKSDLQRSAEFADGTFSLVLAQGDPLSFVPDPALAVRHMARILRPGGIVAAGVDSRFGGLDVFVKRARPAEVDELASFLRTGTATWLADDTNASRRTRSRRTNCASSAERPAWKPSRSPDGRCSIFAAAMRGSPTPKRAESSWRSRRSSERAKRRSDAPITCRSFGESRRTDQSGAATKPKSLRASCDVGSGSGASLPTRHAGIQRMAPPWKPSAASRRSKSPRCAAP